MLGAVCHASPIFNTMISNGDDSAILFGGKVMAQDGYVGYVERVG